MRLSGSSWQVPSGRPPRRSVQASAAVPYPRADAAQNFSQYFATCHPGLEDVVAAELNSPDVGASDISHGKAGVSFRYMAEQQKEKADNFQRRLEADIIRSWVNHIVHHSACRRLHRGGVGVGYRANLWLRSSIRVLQLVAESQLNNCNDAAYELYAATRRVPVLTCLLPTLAPFLKGELALSIDLLVLPTPSPVCDSRHFRLPAGKSC